jgi:septation ring formation regulator EzrA
LNNVRLDREDVKDIKEALICDKDRRPLSYTCCIELFETIEGLYGDVDSLMEQLNRNIFAMDDAEAKIEALQQENEQLKDENISIRKWNKCVDEDYPKLLEENKRLQYTLIGVMHSVDKWFDEVDENVDEVNRAVQAREIALQAIEKRDEALKVAMEAINGYSTCPYCWGVNGHAKGCKFYEALQNIDALIGGKEYV